MTFSRVVTTEFLKLRRSALTWISLLVYLAMAGMSALFLWMMKDPDGARSLGLLGQKAAFAFGGQAVDWATYLSFIGEMAGIGGLIMSALIATFVFGREYVEGTEKNVLALPERRSSFVAAKVLVASLWFLALSLCLIPLACAAGALVGLGAPEAGLVARASTRVAALAAMALCCMPLVAWVAVASKGFFAPLGFALGTLVVASVFGHTGWAPWVPWCVVGIASGAAGEGPSLGAGSYLVLVATFVAGLGLTLRHECRADNSQ
jgi:ABC-type transport system involved in multi-copper enzyme maturation, permease component